MPARPHDFEADVLSTLELVEEIRPILAGNDPALIGAALADLSAMFFAGHHPSIREEVLRDWLAAMKKLIPPNEQTILDRYGGKWPNEKKMGQWRKDQ